NIIVSKNIKYAPGVRVRSFVYCPDLGLGLRQPQPITYIEFVPSSPTPLKRSPDPLPYTFLRARADAVTGIT
ncbi:hypothetical protein BaRGS_00034770, partial [Batillaria attramentaria]